MTASSKSACIKEMKKKEAELNKQQKAGAVTAGITVVELCMLHIFRRTFATRMYEKGARVKEIAAYIGDLESTTERYYIAVRKKVKEGNGVHQVVMVPGSDKG